MREVDSNHVGALKQLEPFCWRFWSGLLICVYGCVVVVGGKKRNICMCVLIAGLLHIVVSRCTVKLRALVCRGLRRDDIIGMHCC